MIIRQLNLAIDDNYCFFGNSIFWPMNLIDTHTHLYVEQFDEDQDEVVQSALKQGIERFYIPSIDSAYTQRMHNLRSAYPEQVYLMAGLHPGSVDENYEAELEHVKYRLETETPCAVGEIGIDLYWEQKYQDQQVDAFRQQIRWAKAYKLPIVIHCRAAFDEVFAVLEQENDDQLYGIFHCFTGNSDQAKRAIDLGFYLGIGGVVTFKNAGLDKVIRNVDPQHIVLETDAPYLAPAPKRGKRNESAYLTYIARKLADILGLPMKEVANITTKNALSVFNHG